LTHTGIEIRLVIVIQVIQSCDLITTYYIDLVLDYFNSQWLMEPGGKALPANIGKVAYQSFHQPDFARHGCDRSRPIT
jgi:hypothetical protein